MDSYQPLVVNNKITVTTQNGHCEIWLLLGDITQLPLEEKVDIIMVSAFPGDYAASTGSLIGALHKNLGITVRKLAMDKDMDLRKHFHCWLSKALPEDLPYRRLLCFERQISKILVHIAALVGDVFRGLTPIFNNHDSTMITPLLGTGLQNFSPEVMLRSIVDAACNWMKAGLPLRQLKIVLYTRDPTSLTEEHTAVVQLFAKLKYKWEKRGATLQASSMRYDIYFSYSKTDEDTVSKMKHQLKQKQKDIKIFTEKQEMWAEHAWQEAMFETMTACKRIVALLSPAYLESTDCMEQFNIALCCARLQTLTLLAPLYIETVPSMPAYMQLVQYIDCRGKLADLTLSASEEIIQSINESSSLSEGEMLEKNENYDVFISYSHKHTEEAEHLLKLLSKHTPTAKIFFDRSGLKTGKSWQKTLYSVLGTVRCVVAMVTTSFVQSSVCQEEYNISLYRSQTKGADFLLVPVCIDTELLEVPVKFTAIKMVDARGEKFTDALKEMCQSIDTWLKDGTRDSIPPHLTVMLDVDKTHEDRRAAEIEEHYYVDKNLLEKKSHRDHKLQKTESTTQKLVDTKCEVCFCYGPNDTRLAAVLAHMIIGIHGDLTIHLGAGSPQERLHQLDTASHVVFFISPLFMKSAQLVEGLHLALCRRRALRKPSLVYAILTSILEPQPVFLHLVQYSMCLTDAVWGKLGKEVPHLQVYRNVLVSGDLKVKGSYRCSHSEMMALKKAALELTEIIGRERDGKVDTVDGQCVNLVNIECSRRQATGLSVTENIPLDQVLWIDKRKHSANEKLDSKETNKSDDLTQIKPIEHKSVKDEPSAETRTTSINSNRDIEQRQTCEIQQKLCENNSQQTGSNQTIQSGPIDSVNGDGTMRRDLTEDKGKHSDEQQVPQSIDEETQTRNNRTVDTRRRSNMCDIV